MGSGRGDQAGAAYGNLLQPFDASKTEELFQTSVVDPAMLQYQQQVLPSIQQRFTDANAGSSSALNQALAQSAGDLTTTLGGQMGNFFNQQQQLSQQGNLGALSGLNSLGTQQTFQPMIGQDQGILGPLLGAAGQIGAGYMMSSELAKENVRDYSKGLDVLDNLEVKIYDYKEKHGGAKNRVGVIAENTPDEIQREFDGMKHVDLYGLVGILINSVKELSKKIAQLGG